MNVLRMDAERLERATGFSVPPSGKRRWGFYLDPVLLVGLLISFVVAVIFLNEQRSAAETFFYVMVILFGARFSIGEIGQGICLGMYGRRVASFQRVGWWMRAMSSLLFIAVIPLWCIAGAGLLSSTFHTWSSGAMVGGLVGTVTVAVLVFFTVREYRRTG